MIINNILGGWCNMSKANTKQYKGMNFKKWCGLDKNDNRKIVYVKTLYGSFTSDDYIDREVVSSLQELIIENVTLDNNE
jgi:hypothetical protein